MKTMKFFLLSQLRNKQVYLKKIIRISLLNQNNKGKKNNDKKKNQNAPRV